MKRIFLMFLVTCMFASTMSTVVIADTDEDFAVEAVVLAENSRLQTNIDCAQIAIAGLEKGTQRAELEERIDKVQSIVDSTLYVDFSDYEIGPSSFYSGNASSSEVISEDGNNVLKISLTENNNGGWGQEYYLNNSDAIGADFTLEQKFRYEGNFSTAGEIKILDKETGALLFDVLSNGCILNSNWNVVYNNESQLTVGKWYNVVYKLSNEKYQISVVDVNSGVVLFTTSEADANVTKETFRKLSYQFGGATGDSSAKIYIDELKITPVSAVSTARNAVVKAERSKSDTDIIEAQIALDLLEDSTYKTELTKRLEAVGAFDKDSVETLILKATTTMAQADIDAAQIAVSKTEPGTKRESFEKKLDKLQAKVDATYYFDQNSNNPLSGWNFETACDDNAGYYNIIDYDNTEVTNVNHKFQILSNQILQNPYKLEQKLRFSDNIGDGFLYLQGLWGIKGINGEIRSVAEWHKSSVADLEPDTWYNIVYSFDGNIGCINVINIETDENVGILENIVPASYFAGDGLWYAVDNHYVGKIHLGDTILTQITPVKTARNAVVRAERTELEEDITKAQICINNIESGEEKTGLQKRLNVLQTDKLIFENLKIQKEQSDGKYRDTSVLSSGNIKIKTDALTYNAQSINNAQLILGLYEIQGENRRFVRCSTSDVKTVTYENPAKLEAVINVPDNASVDYELGVFVWGGLDTLIPHYKTCITSYRDAFKVIEAEDYSKKSGSAEFTAVENRNVLSSIKTNDYTVYENVMFGDTGANSIEAEISGITTNGKIDIRLDSSNGELIGTIDGLNTADWGNYNTITANIENTTGIHDVYFVYTEGLNVDKFRFCKDKVQEVPYYGAKFEPKGNSVYTGAGQGDFVALMSMTNTANQNKKPEIIAVYNWILSGCTEEIYNAHANFPGAKLQIGTALMVNNYQGMQELAGGVYDNEIRKYAQQLKALPHDIFLRIGYECDGPWNNYDPELYKISFRRIVDIFREEKVDNVAYVWNIAYPTLTLYNAMNYYPGDEYVDWWSYDFWVEQGNSNNPTDFVETAKLHNKPVLVGESSKQYVQFSNGFWDKYFGLIENYPTIKGYQYINWYWNTYGTSDWLWGDGRYTTDPKWVARFNQQVSDGKYLGLDASYFNTSGLAIQFGHVQEFLNNQSELFNKPWNKEKDNYTFNEGYGSYEVYNAKYSESIISGQHTIKPADNNDFVTIEFTVPEGKDGMIYFNDLNFQPKDVYIGARKILENSRESGKYNYYASDVVDGKLELKLKNVGDASFMVDTVMIQRISEFAPDLPSDFNVKSEGGKAYLTWTAVNGADNYNIYRNGRLVAVTSEPGYIDSEYIDGAFYSVTSYDSKNGESMFAQ